MTRPHSEDLRERAVCSVEAGRQSGKLAILLFPQRHITYCAISSALSQLL